MSYKQYFSDILPGQWPRGTTGKMWTDGFAHHMDDMLSDAKDGMKARYPTIAGSAGDDTALAHIGTDRRLRRYPGETDAQYGGRLQQAWAVHRKSGTEQAILTDLVGVGFGDITVMEYRDWPDHPTIANAHESPGDDLDSLGNPWWSRFWVYIGSYNGSDIPSGAVMGVGVMGTAVMGVALSTGIVDSVPSIGRQWKTAHDLFVEVGWLLDGTTTASIMGMAIMGTSTMGPGAGLGVNYQLVNK